MTYLYTHFLDQPDFAQQAGLSSAGLRSHIAGRLCPDASYRLDVTLSVRSFVATHDEQRPCRFHLKGHLRWLEQIERLGIADETAARAVFTARYDAARSAFLNGRLGQRLIRAAPNVPDAFDRAHADATWGNFLDGVYGVCTRDGQPETIFLKQAGVMFIEALTAPPAETLTEQDQALLAEAVAMLDLVASDFAPHEVARSSRQRCINDIRARYL
ncbi:DUF6058 family natural product biosynthesis protein [Paracoccus tegillarcae]|nr:DUF6058 family natural product biosynthesis protein [Paracoccus tegillarcae]